MTRVDARHRIAVLGDDLTGAADAAAPFAQRGLVVSVVLAGSVSDDVEVLAVVSDSRWRPEAQAADSVRAAVARLDDWRPRIRFVKVDSTLRGRVCEDVAIALAGWAVEAAFAAPAFPAQGRTVRDGALFVHGELVLARVADRFPAGVRVVDAESHEELLTLAREVVDRGATAVGSGGLARALAEVVVDPPQPPWPGTVRASGVLVVAGTTHPVTRAQSSFLLDAGAKPVVLGSSSDPVGEAVDALLAGGRVVLSCVPDGYIPPDSAAAVALAEETARSVRAITAQVPSAGLVLTGGATALAVARAVGATEFRLRDEVAQGLPLGELLTGDRRIPVVTKSGGFGDREALVRAAEALEASS